MQREKGLDAQAVERAKSVAVRAQNQLAQVILIALLGANDLRR